MENLWQGLQKYRTRLSPLQIYQVGYPELIEYVVPPTSIIVSVGDSSPGSNTFCQSVLHAAESLVASHNID